MIDHTGIGVADVARSAAFYDAALGALGLRRVVQLPADSGSDAVGYGMPDAFPVFWIDRFHRHGVKQHTAFSARTRAQVDAFYAAALEWGGTDNGPPGLRDTATGYPPGYYAAFVLDPDGNNIEVVLREVHEGQLGIAGEIQQILDARCRAIAAKDVDAVMAHVADDVVSFDVGAPLAKAGGAMVRAALESWFQGYDGPVGFAVRDLRVYGEGDSAFSHALVHVSGRLQSGGNVSMWVRSTIGWARRDGVWMAVHEHMSDPMDFGTGMTRTDLEP